MKNAKWIALAATVLAAAPGLADPADAQWRKRGGGGWGAEGAYGRLFDPKSIETVEGEVVRVERVVPRRGMSGGLHLILKTATEDSRCRRSASAPPS